METIETHAQHSEAIGELEDLVSISNMSMNEISRANFLCDAIEEFESNHDDIHDTASDTIANFRAAMIDGRI